MLDLSTILGDLVKSIVNNPEKVVVTEHTVEEDDVLLTLNVAEDDMGMVIGRRGKIAKAIRTVMKTVAKIDNRKVTVEIK